MSELTLNVAITQNCPEKVFVVSMVIHILCIQKGGVMTGLTWGL